MASSRSHHLGSDEKPWSTLLDLPYNGRNHFQGRELASLPRICLPGIPYHIVQRGNNHQACFASDEDFSSYAHWLSEYAYEFEVAIHAWVFMTNHVHLLATPMKEKWYLKHDAVIG